MKGKYVGVVLSSSDRAELERFSAKGKHSVRLVNRAKIILALDESEGRKKEKQTKIAKRIGVSNQTISNVKNAFFAAQTVTRFLQRKKRTTPPIAPKITDETQAHIIALACSKPPDGYAKWTLRLLADKSIKLGYVNTLSHMSVKRLLKKHNLNLI
ncbi:helix-turn-helix domain-containing protein [Candidatus Bathycorpusculum sp.]|uniref:helix-turn-helix domain-containing protein n=1 Tax=Candidatus Bathycorpusculum sp. TaxID=2994959 RepID=UPI00281F4B86|nr:helix-turn-helix domain-containing protein [Candidatus Termitimicrobium sp.]